VRKALGTTILTSLLIFALATSAPALATTNAAQTPGVIRIYGSVNRPLNLTYTDLLSLPMVSEIARLICVTGSPDVTYNWTGIPLFHLLTLAEIKPEAHKVITRASDGYKSELLIEEALKPTTILALRANGAELPQLTYGPAGPYRLIVPGKWGFIWVSGIEAIQIVPTTTPGYYDASNVPDYGPMPTLTPSLQTLDLRYQNRTFEVETFTNASIAAYSLNPSQKTLDLSVRVPKGTSAFMDLIIKQNFLGRPYNITSDEKPISAIEGDTNTTSYLYFTFEEGLHTTSISGTEFANTPEPVVDYAPIVIVGQSVTFDASKSADVGRIVSYTWSFGDGTSGAGAVVSHVYDKEGAYEVKLNVTNDKGISSTQTFTITVKNSTEYIVPLFKAVIAAMLVTLILILAFLLRNRKKTQSSARSTQSPR
jgi:hypothetical protein